MSKNDFYENLNDEIIKHVNTLAEAIDFLERCKDKKEEDDLNSAIFLITKVLFSLSDIQRQIEG